MLFREETEKRKEVKTIFPLSLCLPGSREENSKIISLENLTTLNQVSNEVTRK